jgi:hypothetical protein
VQESPQQLAQMRALDRPDELGEVGGHLRVRHRRDLGQVGQVVLVLGRGAQALDSERGAVALVHRVAAEHADHRPAGAERGELVDLVPDDRLHAPGGVP